MLAPNPAHDASVIASASQPNQESSAPRTTNTMTAASCHTMWSGASSVVDHDAKKPVTIRIGGRRGGWNDTNVQVAPKIAHARNTHETIATIVALDVPCEPTRGKELRCNT